MAETSEFGRSEKKESHTDGMYPPRPPFSSPHIDVLPTLLEAGDLAVSFALFDALLEILTLVSRMLAPA